MIKVNYDLFKTRNKVLLERIKRAQVISGLTDEQTDIAVKIAKGEATAAEITRSDEIANRYLPNAIEFFRLHMEGSGSLVRAYQMAHSMVIQTMALDFLRTIQMVKP
jgi:hypothetical protein